MKEKVFVSIVLYVSNDEPRIAPFLTDLDKYLYDHFENYELVLVNDYSSDGSLAKLREVSAAIRANATILNLSRHHGTELAMLAGLHKSIGDFVFEMDTMDIDYSFEILSELYKTATAKGFDIVSATPTKTRTRSKLFYRAINRFSYFKELDLTTEKLRLVSRRSLNAMLGLKEKIRYRKALYALTGFSSTKLSYENSHTASGKSFRSDVSQALEVLVSFSYVGLKLSHALSLVFFLFSLFMIGYSIYNYLFNKDVVQGWTTIMIMLSTGFSGMFLIIGLMGEYIARILTEVQDRPFYSTKSVEIYKENTDIKKAQDKKAQRSVS